MSIVVGLSVPSGFSAERGKEKPLGPAGNYIDFEVGPVSVVK